VFELRAFGKLSMPWVVILLPPPPEQLGLKVYTTFNIFQESLTNIFVQAGLKLQSFYFCLPRTWGYTCAPPCSPDYFLIEKNCIHGVLRTVGTLKIFVICSALL
jgi:hypothetical protein